MAKEERVTIGDLRIQLVAQRRPRDLIIGPIGGCTAGHITWFTCFRYPDGTIWCELCWWQSSEGQATLVELQAMGKALKDQVVRA